MAKTLGRRLVDDHFLKVLSQKPGIIFVEFEEMKNLLELYCGAKLLDVEIVRLTEFGRKEKFYKFKVNDLAQAYRVLADSWKTIW